jgi:hypothetical protein
MSNPEIIFFNGINNGIPPRRETEALRFLERQGFSTTHAHINWFSDESYENLFARLLEKSAGLLKKNGSLILAGHSAGGSVAVNIAHALNSPDTLTISIAGRLHVGSEHVLNPWHLKRAMRMDSEKGSPKGFYSIEDCEVNTLPALSAAEKQRIVILKPAFDPIVPLQTMDIPGVEILRIPARGHNAALKVGMHLLPQLIEERATA